MKTALFAKKLAEGKGLILSEQQVEKLDIFEKMLLEWNKKMNLTAITDSEGIAIKHFYDSFTPEIYLDLPKGASLIDVGTGAGFPSVPLAILRPDLKFTLLDSLNKRIKFLGEVCSKLNIDATLIHSRAEDGSRNPGLREQFDISISRAVACMPVLCEYCIPFVKKGGMFIAMKGPKSEEEIKSSIKAIDILGGKLENNIKISLTYNIKRTIIIIRKVNYTSIKYPRRASKIVEKPL